MFFMILLVAVTVCIYWNWAEEAPAKAERVGRSGAPARAKSVPLAASIRKYEVGKTRAAS